MYRVILEKNHSFFYLFFYIIHFLESIILYVILISICNIIVKSLILNIEHEN